MEGRRNHFVAARKNSQSKHALEGIGLQTDELVSVSRMHLFQVFRANCPKQLLNSVEERLTWLRHGLDWLTPQLHRLHLLQAC